MQNVQTARARTQRALGQPTVHPPPSCDSSPPCALCLSHAANLLQPPWCIFHFAARAARSAVIWIKYASAVPQLGAGVAVGSLWVLLLQLQLFGLELWPAWVIKVNYIFHGSYQLFRSAFFLLPSLIAFYEHYFFFLFMPCPWSLSLSLSLSLWWFFHSINLRVDLFAGDTGSCFFPGRLLLLFIWKSVQTRCGIIATCCV